MERAKPYQHPYTVHKEGKEALNRNSLKHVSGKRIKMIIDDDDDETCVPVSRPQPLSTITKRSTSEKVMSRAGFINNVLTKIEEVWSGKGTTPQSSPAKK